MMDRAGKMYMEYAFTNRTPSPMTDFAVQFNVNS
jgi:hypothetical protein